VAVIAGESGTGSTGTPGRLSLIGGLAVRLLLNRADKSKHKHRE